MKITKEQFQNWAAEHGDKETNDFVKHVPLSVEQAIILRAKIESAVLYGADLAATLNEKGADITSAKDAQCALYRLRVKPAANN